MSDTSDSLSCPAVVTAEHTPAMTVSDISMHLLDEYCVLCNVWVAGSAAQHTRGARHLRWAKAAQCAFRAAAPAACAVAAALLRLEAQAELSGPFCHTCAEPVAGGFRGAVTHLRSLHHCHRRQRREQALMDAQSEYSEQSEQSCQSRQSKQSCISIQSWMSKQSRQSAQSAQSVQSAQTVPGARVGRCGSLVCGVLCSLCECAVPGWPERHFLSGRHKRNAMGLGAEALARAQAQRAMWEQRLEPLFGNICCCCAEYVPHGEIVEHFASARHTRAQAACGTRAEELRAQLQRAPPNTNRRYCAICRAAPKSSMSLHLQGRAHSMALIRTFTNDKDVEANERHMEQLAKEKEKKAKRMEKEEANRIKRRNEEDERMNAAMEEEDGSSGNGGTVQTGPLLLPPLFRFVRGECVICGEAVVADATTLIADLASTVHCCADKKQLELDDSPIALAGQWLAMAFRALREDPRGTWVESIESQSLCTGADFAEVLQCDERVEVFANAVCDVFSSAQV